MLTNKLFSLTGEGSGRRWTNEFPPMPTKRSNSTALCIEAALVVAGGIIKVGSFLRTVEVLDIEVLQWYTAASPPKSFRNASAAVCGDQIYILGEYSMFTCSAHALLQSGKSVLASLRNTYVTRVWREMTAPPVALSTCVSICGRLLAIGGRDRSFSGKPTTAVHTYHQATDSWNVISLMETPRRDCIAAVLSNNQLMVVGGYTTEYTETDSIEFATMCIE